MQENFGMGKEFLYILIFFVGIMTWHKYLPSHTIGNRP